MNEPHHYYIVNKPYNMVSQFVSTHQVRLLGDLGFSFPNGTHAVGRLDSDSEGLLILTTNKKVTRLLFLGATPHQRTYLVQVNNILGQEQLRRLQTGVTIRVKNGIAYTTPPCSVEVIAEPEAIYPISNGVKEYGPHTWLVITLTEGKFHQVRKMMAAVNHRCRRLIRISIEALELAGLPPGEVREIAEADFFSSLRIGAPES